MIRQDWIETKLVIVPGLACCILPSAFKLTSFKLIADKSIFIKFVEMNAEWRQN